MSQSEFTGKKPFSYAGDVFLLISVFAWGVNFPVAKYTLHSMPPIAFSSSRYFMASLILFAFLKLQKRSLALTVKEAFSVAGIGLLGVTLFQGGWAFGLSMTSASKASIIISITPVFGALISGILGNWPSVKAWIGIAISLGGTFIVINNSLTAITIGEGRIEGDLLIIFAAAIWAVYTAVSGPMLAKTGPVFVTAWAMLFGATFLSLIGISDIIEHDWLGMGIDVWAALLFTAVMGGALAFVGYSAGVSRIGMTKGMTYSFLIPLIAILTAYLFLGETLTLVQLSGGLIALFGVWLTRVS